MKENNAMTKKKISIANLIADAENIKKRKKETKDLYIKSFDGSITITKPDRELINDFYDMDDIQGNLYLVYESVVEPNFKDTSLQEAYGVIGYDVLDEIFDPGEIDTIAKEIVKFGGYGDSVEEIKN